MIAPIYIRTNSVQGFLFLHILANFVICVFFWWQAFCQMWDDTSWFWFAFLQWLVVVSIFSCACWPSVYPLWKNVCLGLLPELLWWLRWQRICLQCGRHGFNPRSGRSFGEGIGNPLQYSCLENSMDREVWRAAIRGVAKNWTQLRDLHFHTFCPFFNWVIGFFDIELYRLYVYFKY